MIGSKGTTVIKKRIKELGEAINDTLANSDQIAEVIARIKEEGYDVFLVLEATVGFNKREDEAGLEASVAEEAENGPPDLTVTAQDVRFLRSLRIKVDDDRKAA
jgi:hypothetical protein